MLMSINLEHECVTIIRNSCYVLLAYSNNNINQLLHLIRSSVRDPMYEMVDLSLNEPSMSATNKHEPLQPTSDTVTKKGSCDYTSDNRVVHSSPSRSCHAAEYLTPITSDNTPAKSSEVQTDTTYQALILPHAQQKTVSSEYQSLMQAKSSVVNTTNEENTYQPLIPLRAHKNTVSTEYQSLTQFATKCQSSADSESPPPVPPKTKKDHKQ